MRALTKQQIFDKVYVHLLTQMQKAQVTNNYGFNCKYRTEGGLKCAIGCLIPDEFYDDGMEYKVVSDLFCSPRYSERLLSCGLTADKLSLLDDLQTIHDRYSVQSWAGRLDGVATNWKLNIPEGWSL